MSLKKIATIIDKSNKWLLAFLGFVMLISAHYLMYENHTQIGNQNKTPLFIFPAFFLFYGGITCLGEICHRVYTSIEKRIETKKRLLKNIYNVTIFTLIIISIFLPHICYTTKYDQYQLANFGTMQEVVIKKIFYRSSIKGGGSEYASFHIKLNDSIIYKELPKRAFFVGDTGTVIFSSQNPNIIKWFNEYTKK